MTDNREQRTGPRPQYLAKHLSVICSACRYRTNEHDPINLACPDDDDHARLNREEWS